ncbi:site-specific integrase [Mucilaginibacter rubeus]|uniref:Site-specific integrase n=1 Tax=Mucilaginibacter rubeus TaxID=2027860 RepID=A0AAE6MHC5_9SPHI|nr:MULTISPECIES: site-specific integrase [Mucilaginibacter]QEM03037.1 site-specific integrase [Mucilaginibacter rubeus]QEM15656.1 site-specific integrase [Mucilaginibacter gossypii]QTE41610.1 site-specific integrase [Mucilaginibacter rubeus]QTE48215.1 site-specific integrase [Mucilaginibacter rubeus]QTE59604.1 site-specific integrase [Mucilaginibacter rubeus]
MRSSNTFGIQFVIRLPKQQKNDQATVFARITVNGRRCEISLKKKVNPQNWDEAKGKARGTKDETRKLNEHIERVRTLIADGYHELVQQKKVITVDAVKSLFLGADDNEITLIKLGEYHNTEMKDKLAEGTMKNYYTTQKYIAKFLKEKYHRNDISLAELNYKFILDFETFLSKHQPKDHQKPLHNNGIMKHIERLCKMVNMAVTMDWIVKDPFAKYKQHFDKVERFYLTKEELSAIENKKFSIERLQTVKDLFLFSCYTGLAYIDTMNLTAGNIVKGIDGNDWLITSRQKTDTDVRIPLLPQAEELIKKYHNHPKAVNYGTLFPVISNQKMNAYLKEIADLCNINKAITFHIARHTFATTVTLSNGVPIESVSKMLGHTTIRSTQVYAKVVEQKLSEDMQNLKKRMANQ